MGINGWGGTEKKNTPRQGTSVRTEKGGWDRFCFGRFVLCRFFLADLGSRGGGWGRNKAGKTLGENFSEKKRKKLLPDFPGGNRGEHWAHRWGPRLPGGGGRKGQFFFF